MILTQRLSKCLTPTTALVLGKFWILWLFTDLFISFSVGFESPVNPTLVFFRQ